ncbi:MAG TPA: amidohydrolase family protein [Myxococcota bacterium]|nr:amidohydrolase family protein [Myxococcota bacterium]
MHRIIRVCAALSGALIAACASPAPSVRVARSEPRPSAVWIADVAVLDVATGVRTPDRDVLIANGRIAAIARSGAGAPPPAAALLSGSGATLVPGLVDMHGHVYANSNPIWAPGLPDPDANLRAYLYCGVTTVFDPGDQSAEAFDRRSRVASGELAGPHIYTAGPLHTAPEGHPIALVREFAPWWIGWYVAPRVAVAVDSVEQANAAIDRLAEHHPDAVKIVIDEIPLGSPRLRPEVARAIADRAKSHGLRTVAHIGTTRDAIIAAESGVAMWMHGVYKERIPDSDIAVLAGYHIPMVATIEVFDSYARLRSGPREATALERETVPARLLDSFYPPPEGFSIGSLTSWQELNERAAPDRTENVRRLHAAGVEIFAGSDTQSGVFPGPGLHRELQKLARAGLSPIEVIRAATLGPARFLAKTGEPDWGNVAVGQRADLLLVEGDPTRDVAALSAIRVVLEDGVPIARTPVVNPPSD